MTDGNETAEAEDGGAKLTERDLAEAGDPIRLFGEWLAEATEREPNDPTAMALATVDAEGMPDARMVLLKAYEQGGFVFYTNLESRKGRQLAAEPRAALLFHWKSVRRQVRIRGEVRPVTAEEADVYFATRPRLARIGAWASRQSEPLESRFALEKAVARYTAKYPAGAVPRPPHWSGFRLVPKEIEFWREGGFRLHDRIRFSRDAAGGWTKTRLFP
ncbi:MAG: pyridoxamine 5'-phosphate oxidase [Propylenella sp.]